jgi:hypothetical protein
MREEKGLGVENRDRIGCSLSTLVREGEFPPRILGATQVASPALAVSSLRAGSLELALVGLGWERQGKHMGREEKRNGRRTGGPTLGLPLVPTGVVAAFIAAVYRGSESITRQAGPS